MMVVSCRKSLFTTVLIDRLMPMKIKRRLPILQYGLSLCAVVLISISLTVGFRLPIDADLIAGIMTSLTVILLFLAWRDAQHTKDDAERPHISIMLRLTSDTYRVLVITNSGKSVALNCQLRLRGVKHGLNVETPTPDNDRTLKIVDNPLFNNSAELPAGWMYEFLLQDGKAYAGDPQEEVHPRKFSVDVSFESLRGTRYEYSVPIDINAHKHSMVPQQSVSGRLEIIAKEWFPVVKDIRTELASLRYLLTPKPTHYEDGRPIKKREE